MESNNLSNPKSLNYLRYGRKLNILLNHPASGEGQLNSPLLYWRFSIEKRIFGWIILVVIHRKTIPHIILWFCVSFIHFFELSCAKVAYFDEESKDSWQYLCPSQWNYFYIIISKSFIESPTHLCPNLKMRASDSKSVTRIERFVTRFSWFVTRIE